MTAMVEIKNLTKRFGSYTAVDHISFSVAKGEVLGFLGPNGAGKSTTMKMITGFLSPNEGEVIIMGENISDKPVVAKSRIGYLPEGAPAYQDMTPERFLEFIADIRGLTGELKIKRIKAVIEQINLQNVLYQTIDTLSKGFKRRVGLAQAILHDPPILILDEPTDGLDPNQKKEVRQLILNMASEKAIILSTHILEEVEAVCTRATIIAGGKVVADGSPAELQQKSELYNSISLSVESAKPDAMMQALKSIAGVERVDQIASAQGAVRYILFPKEKRSIVTAVHEAIAKNKWEVDEFHIDKGRLDDVFHRITHTEQAMS